MSFDSVMGKTIYPVKSIAVGCDFISGYAFKGKDFTDADGHPIIKIKNIQDGKVTIKESQFIPKHLTGKKLEKFKLENGDILIAMTGQGSVGRVGKLYISTTETPYLNQRVGKFLVDEENLNKEYLYYVLSCKAYENYLFAAGSGSGQPNLSPALIKAVEIPYPPYKSQCYIGKILSDLDEKIHLNNQINQTLESIAQTIFKSWFIDFEPVRAKIIAKQEGKDTELAAMCAISGKSEVELQQMAEDDLAELRATASLFPDELVESELGEVPKGWELQSLYDTAEFVNGAAFKAKDFSSNTNEGLPIIKIAELKQGLSAQTKYTNLSFDQKYRVRSGDIFYSWSGSPETSLDVFKWFGRDGWLNQHIFKINTESKGKTYFVYYLLKYLKPTLIRLATNKQTTGLGHITVADMKSLQVIKSEEHIFIK